MLGKCVASTRALAFGYPVETEQIISAFMRAPRRVSDELRQYAEDASEAAFLDASFRAFRDTQAEPQLVSVAGQNVIGFALEKGHAGATRTSAAA